MNAACGLSPSPMAAAQTEAEVRALAHSQHAFAWPVYRVRSSQSWPKKRGVDSSSSSSPPSAPAYFVSVWNAYVPILAGSGWFRMVWGWFGIVLYGFSCLGMFWGWFRMVLGMVWDCFRWFGMVWGCFGMVLYGFGCFGNELGTVWDGLGMVWG